MQTRLQCSSLLSISSLKTQCQAHVGAGTAPFTATQLNIGSGSGGAFTEFVAMALGKTLTGNQFNPYTHDQLFLIAAFILEDVMVTAYQVLLTLTLNPNPSPSQTQTLTLTLTLTLAHRPRR